MMMNLRVETPQFEISCLSKRVTYLLQQHPIQTRIPPQLPHNQMFQNNSNSQRTIQTNLVENMLAHFLLNSDKFRFVVQLDQLTIDNICRTIHFCGPKDLIDNPPPHLIVQLRNALLLPQNQGSVYFQRLLRYPENNMFNTRLELTRSFLEAVFNLVWGVPQYFSLNTNQIAIIKQKIRLSVVQGPKAERGVVQVSTSQCNPHHTPMLVPEIGKMSLAFNYIDSARSYYNYLARWLTEYSGTVQLTQVPRSFDVDRISSLMIDLATQQTIASLALDEGNTPSFAVSIPASCCRLE
eukprot:c9010_g1_i1.p1 GENE.c9010_g1_i1~~c9010_g1_i1.p1  ORF type:complete len:295 (+),score=63.74 c9010_g1_i1:69-953(+)